MVVAIYDRKTDKKQPVTVADDTGHTFFCYLEQQGRGADLCIGDPSTGEVLARHTFWAWDETRLKAIGGSMISIPVQGVWVKATVMSILYGRDEELAYLELSLRVIEGALAIH